MKKDTRTNSDYLAISEYRLLNGLIGNPGWLNDSRVYEDIFFHPTAKSIFEAIKYHIDNKMTISESSLFQKANEIDYNIDLTAIKMVKELDNENPVLNEILNSLNKGIQKHNLRKIAVELLEEVNSHEELDATSVSGSLSKMNEVITNSFNHSIMKTAEEWTDDYYKELIDRQNGKVYSFGDAHLDKYLMRKAAPGQFILLAGATGAGKSAYALNLVNGFINLNIPSIYISLEMDGISTFDRLLAMRTEIPVEHLYGSGDDLIPIMNRFKEEKKELDKSKSFFFIEDPNLSLVHIQSLIREFKQRTGHKYLIVVCDLITMVQDFQEGAGNTTLASTMEMAINKLNGMCKEENICFLGVAQFNRQADSARVTTVEELEMLRPQLNHVKNSHALGERSRVVLSAFRAKYYAERYLQAIPEIDEMEDVLSVQILKQSQGKVGTMMDYAFEGEIFRCFPIDHQEVDTLSDNE